MSDHFILHLILNMKKTWVLFLSNTENERNSLSVYACAKGAPVLLEKRELLDCNTSKMKLFNRPGALYTRQSFQPSFSAIELFNLTLKQRGSSVDISWDPLNLQEQATFIKNYTVYDDNNAKQLISKGIVKSFFPHLKMIFVIYLYINDIILFPL